MTDDEYDGVETVISPDMQRALKAVPFGIAAYEGGPHPIAHGQWQGRHVGIFDDPDAATSWLETGDPKPKPVPEPGA